MMTFTAYVFEFIVCKHILDVENSIVLDDSVRSTVHDPDNLEELSRLNMEQQMQGMWINN